MIMVSPTNKRLKRVNVRVEQQVSQHQYDSLVTTIVNDNNLAIGTLLTIKVKGHAIYKKVIDGIKLQVSSGTLHPDVIQFKPIADTLITVSGKTTYHATANGYMITEKYYANDSTKVKRKKTD